MTVSFFVQNDASKKSSIKFGSYDQIGLKPGSKLELIRTPDKGSWDLRANFIEIGTEKLAEASMIRFEPQLPYLYLPRTYYRAFVEAIQKLYSDESLYGDKDICDETENICRFDAPCDEVDKKKIEFGIRIYDEERDIHYKIDWSEMYLSGEHFGGNGDECYIPVFDHGKSKDSDANLVYVGNLFLKKYYVVFDLSTLEKDLDYIQVGIGERND